MISFRSIKSTIFIKIYFLIKKENECFGHEATVKVYS